MTILLEISIGSNKEESLPSKIKVSVVLAGLSQQRAVFKHFLYLQQEISVPFQNSNW